VAYYLLRRVGQAIPILIGLTVCSFLLIHLAPGDPARIILGLRATPSAIAAVRAQLHLNESLPAQYGGFLLGALHFNFGTSFQYHQSVGSLIAPRILPSILLVLYALVIGVVLALPLAVWSAMKAQRLPDHLIRVLTMVTFAMPAFWLGVLLILIFSVRLHLFPAGGYGLTFGSHLQSLVLPGIVLGLYLCPMLLRTLRSSLIESLRSEYVEAARARGYSEARIVWRHALRNSLISGLTVMGANIAFLLSGTVIVESVFSIPGLGSLLVSSVSDRDFPVVTALTLLFGVFVLIVNIITDVSYAFADPRVRLWRS
jgi:peptide/nickel transport system permease protein